MVNLFRNSRVSNFDAQSQNSQNQSHRRKTAKDIQPTQSNHQKSQASNSEARSSQGGFRKSRGKYSHISSKVDTGLRSGKQASIKPKDNDIFGTYSTNSVKSRNQNGVHFPKAAGTRAPFHDKAHQKLPTLDQVGVTLNTEPNRDLAVNTDTLYKKDFRKDGFKQHTPMQKELDHPVKIYAPETTPFGAKRFPNSATSMRNFFEKNF